MKTLPAILPVYLLALLFFLGAGCQTMSENGPVPAYRDVTAEELESMLEQDEGLLLVDVREADEYDSGHIPGSILRPLDQLKENPGSLNPERSIVLICQSGRRCVDAAGFLAGEGFETLYYLNGGLEAWTGPVQVSRQRPG